MDNPDEGRSNIITKQERLEILRTVNLFQEAPSEALAEVADVLEEVSVARGQTLFEKGDLGTSVYIVVRGLVRVHDGDKLLNYLGNGDVFGEMAILDPGPRSASVTAAEETLLFCLDEAPFRQLQASSPEFTDGVIRMMSTRLRARMQDVKDVYEELRRYHEHLEELVADRTAELAERNEQLRQEIAERKQIEAALSESEEKYRMFFTNEFDAISICDETGQIQDVNPAWQRLYGYTWDEARTMKVTDISVESAKTAEAVRQASSKGGVSIPVRWHKNRNGRVFPVEISEGVFSWRGRNLVERDYSGHR